MNCQYCGKKIGILENWRYGRFCSKEHQTAFQEESSQLAVSVLSQPGGPAAKDEEAAILTLSAYSRPDAPGDPAPRPDPPLMDAVPQREPAAVRCAPPDPPPPPPPAGERDQRCLKLLAALDRMPPALEKDSRRRLVIEDAPYRFGMLTVKGTRRVLVPPSGAVQRRPKLVLAATLLPLRYNETGAPMPEFEPAWQGEAAWESDEAAPVTMDFGQYLEDYTPDQPWQEWDWDALLDEAKYFQTLNEQREKQRDQLRSHKAGEKATERPPAAQTPKPGYLTAPARPWQGSIPSPVATPNLASSAPAGQPGTRIPAPPARFQAASHSAGPGGILLPSAPSYPGTTGLRPVLSGSARSAGNLGGQRLTLPSRTGPGDPARSESGHVQWVELAPPPFMALCKIDGPSPIRGYWRPVHPPSPPAGVQSVLLVPRGAAAMPSTSGLALGGLKPDPAEAARPLALDFVATAVPARPRPPAVISCIPQRRPGRARLALPPSPVRKAVVLDLRPLPAFERPSLPSRIAG